MPSFDVTSQIDLQEVDNAVNQARKEVGQRYDFKGSKAAIDFDRSGGTLTLVADDEFKLRSLWEVVETRMVRRKVPVKNLKPGEIERGANDTVRRVITLQQGIPTETGREIVKVLAAPADRAGCGTVSSCRRRWVPARTAPRLRQDQSSGSGRACDRDSRNSGGRRTAS